MDTPRRERLVDELVSRADKRAHFSRLRRKIEPTDNKRLIHTDHRVDYRMVDVHAENAGRNAGRVGKASDPSCLGQRSWSRRVIKPANATRRDRPAEAGSEWPG